MSRAARGTSSSPSEPDPRRPAGGPDASEPEIRTAVGEAERAAALEVRLAVFVREQGVPLPDELDGLDDAANHFVVVWDGSVVGTARMVVTAPGTVKIGRVAILPTYRNRGWGGRLLEAVLAEARAGGLSEVYLDAQTGAVRFYERLGFRVEGEQFLDAGIPHLRMRLQPVRLDE